MKSKKSLPKAFDAGADKVAKLDKRLDDGIDRKTTETFEHFDRAMEHFSKGRVFKGLRELFSANAAGHAGNGYKLLKLPVIAAKAARGNKPPQA